MSDAAGSEENNNMRIARGVGYPSPLGISNPRVLSDMGLAIPRPTRLGDPRSSSGLLEIIISFGNPSQ